jgi:hypothetical protein
MPDSVFWLVVTNIVLGAVTLLLVVTVITGVLCEFTARIRKRRAAMRELDRDVAEYFGRK